MTAQHQIFNTELGMNGTDAPVESHSTPSLTQDQQFQLLGNDRRRRVIAHLLATNTDPLHTEELADTIATIEAAEQGDSPTSSHRERVTISLAHTHLPKLDQAGVITYTPTQELISPTPKLETLHDHVEPLPGASTGYDDVIPPALAGISGGGILSLLLINIPAGVMVLIAVVLIALSGSVWSTLRMD